MHCLYKQTFKNTSNFKILDIIYNWEGKTAQIIKVMCSDECNKHFFLSLNSMVVWETDKIFNQYIDDI